MSNSDGPSSPPTGSRVPFIVEVRQAVNSPSATEKEHLDPLTAAKVDDQRTDTGLKKLYATWFIGILIGQLFLMNSIFVAVGANWLEFKEPTHLNLFMGGTLAEVFGVVLVITRYLFSKRNG